MESFSLSFRKTIDGSTCFLGRPVLFLLFKTIQSPRLQFGISEFSPAIVCQRSCDRRNVQPNAGLPYLAFALVVFVLTGLAFISLILSSAALLTSQPKET